MRNEYECFSLLWLRPGGRDHGGCVLGVVLCIMFGLYMHVWFVEVVVYVEIRRVGVLFGVGGNS